MGRGCRTDRVDRNRLRIRSHAAAYVIQFFVFLLVAHFQPFSRSRITTLKVAYQPSEKSLGKPWERLVRDYSQCFGDAKTNAREMFTGVWERGGFLQDGNYSGEATPGPLPNLAQR
jgi:hypothetical protein